ncbi:MAG TPA: glycosyltransferase family 4 protein [Chloroflexia bacterium]|nr:glycosyltransferase family 4 protein [Chloroflexia bacterium]
MRILMVTPFLPSGAAANAGELVMYRQLERLAGRHEVTLATLCSQDQDSGGEIADLRRLGIEVHAVTRRVLTGLERWKRRPGLALRWLRGDTPLPVIEFTLPAMQETINRLVAATAPELIQVEYVWMAGYQYPPGVATVLTEHEVGLARARDDLRSTGGARRLRRLYALAEWRRWRRYEPAACRKFTRVQVFTSQDANTLVQHAPDLEPRLRVNPFGVDPPGAPDPGAEYENAVLFVGGFAHPPNVDAALWLAREIMPLVWRDVPGAHLWLVGCNPPAELLALAGERITVTGRVPEIEPYLQRAAVVVAPLRQGGGMRLKVLQAMSACKAVVTTPLGAAGIAEEDSGPLVIASSAEDLARRTVELLANRDMRAELGARAREFTLASYSWEAYMGRLQEIYDEALAAHHSRGKTPGQQ